MKPFSYQLRIVLDSGYVHVTETYTDPFYADAMKRARLLTTSRAGAIDFTDDQGEWVFVRTTKIASITVRDVDNPPRHRPVPEAPSMERGYP